MTVQSGHNMSSIRSYILSMDLPGSPVIWEPLYRLNIYRTLETPLDQGDEKAGVLIINNIISIQLTSSYSLL
jgi:hypothetical protein